MLSIAVAVGLRRLLDPWLGDAYPFATVFFAILLTAWLGGLKPALVAVILGGAASDYFLLPPRGSLKLEGPGQLGMLLYLATGFGIAALGGLMHQARRLAETRATALRASNDLLESRVRERTLELQQKTAALESEIAARRMDETQLKLLETCFSRINDILLITEAEPQDPPGPRIVYVNDAFVRRTGYTREEVLGQTPRILQGPKTSRPELDRIRMAMREWKTVRAELVNYTKTGEEFWIELDIVPVANAAGWFTHWVAVERDITERKQAEEQAARLAAIVQSSDDAIVGKDLDGLVTSWNGGAEKMFGYRAEEMVGQPIRRLIPPERQPEEDEILTKVGRGESVRHFDTVRQHKDGGRLEVSITVSPIKDAGGRIIGVSKVARDIGERNRAANIQRENEARLHLALQAGGMGTFEINLATGEARWNSVEYELLGLKPGEDVPGPETFFRYVHPEDAPALRAAWSDALRSGELSAEFRVRHADGQERWLAGRGRLALPEKDQSRIPTRFLGVNFDITERIHAQQMMRASGERMRLATEATAVGIWEWNTLTNEVRWDAQMFRIYGVAPTPDGRVTYELWRKSVLPEDLSAQEESLQETIRQRGQGHREFRIHRYNDGECRHIQAVDRVSPNQLERADWLVGTNLDITERKRVETALELERRKLSAAFENTDMGFVLFDTRGGDMIMNQAALRFHGFASVADMLTKIEDYAADWELHYPDGRPMPFSEWPVSRAIAADYVQNYEAHLHNVRTDYAWVGSYTTKPVRNRNGEVSLILLTVLDITDRKRAEAAMQESEERFRTMANSMSQLAWIARADGYITWYNQRWYEYTGTTPTQMEGWGWQSVHDPAALPKVMAEWQAAIESGEPFDMEFPLLGADGRFRTFLNRGQPLKDSAGRVVQWYGTNTDVDALKQAEEKVRLLNTELEQRVARRTAQLELANKELEAFSYSVSHDLRAPLRAVNGFAGMVLAEYGQQLPPEGKHYLERIQKGGLRMGQLIDDLLAFSRLTRQPLLRQTVDTHRLVSAALEELKPSSAGRSLEIRLGDLPPCQGDPVMLQQVWINLLANAIKYTAGRDPAIIEIGCQAEPGEAVYFVRDNGAGFDMQFAHKLFGVFQRLHRMAEFEGTGVGLAIVQRIILRHGGRVWAQAALNQGATFFFTLDQTKPE